MSLRGTPVEEDVTLPDGRVIHLRIGVPNDSYIPARELDTVTIELSTDDEHLAAINTVLDVDQGSEGLEAGTLAPTAGALEPLADTLR
jgi:hypothetical protein